KRLADRIFRLCGSCCDGGRSHTGLIGEKTSCNSVLDRIADTASDKASCRRAFCKRQPADRLYRGYDIIIIYHKDNKTSKYIENRHERHKLLADARYRLDPAENDERGQSCDYDADDPGLDPQVVITYLGDGIHLSRTADPERGKSGKHGKDYAKPLHVQPAVKRIHGAALHTSVLCLHAVFHGDQSL